MVTENNCYFIVFYPGEAHKLILVMLIYMN